MFRHAFYETFHHLHILLVCLTIAGLWYHLKDRYAMRYLLAAMGVWVTQVGHLYQMQLSCKYFFNELIQRLIRYSMLLWRNCGRASTPL
jgi:hypothetical protein